MKPKCYIYGMIGNLPEHEYKSSFEVAKKQVILMGYEPVSPVDLPHEHGKKWIDFMKEDIIGMLHCEAVYCLSNWRKSPGATIEIELALKLGLTIFHQND